MGRARKRVLARSLVSASLILVLSGLAGLGAALRPGAAHADGGGGNGASSASTRQEDSDLARAVKAIEAKNYKAAIPLLEGVVARDGKNADAYNWLAYAVRLDGDPAKAVPIYQKALQLDPRHRGAHEYIGEAYLVLDDLARAKQHLARLDSLCFLPCSQYRDLKKAVEAYERSGGKVKPGQH